MRRPRLPVRSAPDRCHCIPSRWPRLLLENSLHHAGADTELPADLEDAVAAGLQFENLRLYFGLKPTPAQFRLSPSRARRPATCCGTASTLLALADVRSSGVKRTSLKYAPRTAFDPERTSALTEMFKVPKSQNRV